MWCTNGLYVAAVIQQFAVQILRMIKEKFGWLAKMLNKSTSIDEEPNDWYGDVRLCTDSPSRLMIKDLNCQHRCEFINTANGKRYSIFHRDLYRTKTLYTKEGWFLVEKKKRGHHRWKKSLLLLNPFTNKKIELPDGVSWYEYECKGAWCLVDGKPELVAFAWLQNDGKKGKSIRLWTIRVADHNNLWTEHIFENRVSDGDCENVFIIGQNIHIVGRTLEFLVFNTSSCEWVRGGNDVSDDNSEIVDVNKGLIWRMASLFERTRALLRLNDNCKELEEFKVEELVLNLSMIKVHNESTKELNKSTSIHEEPNDMHGDFANLPTLVLWMIKDKLDFPNNRRFASVCKGWHDATLSYSKDVRLCTDSPPWLMIKDLKCRHRCEFINTVNGKSYSIFHRDLYRSKTLYTKEGWFLVAKKKRRYHRSEKSLLLLNPFTNKKMELPGGVPWYEYECKGAFSLVDRKPDVVAFAMVQHDGKKGKFIRLWTIRVNDHNHFWTEHTFENVSTKDCQSVFIIGQNIHIVGRTLEFLVFNTSSCEWVREGNELSDGNYEIVDVNKGLIWRIKNFSERTTAMLRLSDNCKELEEFKVKELVHKYWFTTTSCPEAYYDHGYAASEDIDDAIYKDCVQSGYLGRSVKPFHQGDIVTDIIMYVIGSDKNVEWVDIPSN